MRSNSNIYKPPVKGGQKGRQKGRQPFSSCLPDSKPNINNDLHESEVWLTVKEAGQLTGEPERTVKYRCKVKKYVNDLVKGNGGLQYRIALSSLSVEAQMRYRKAAFSGLNTAENLPVLHADSLDLDELRALYLESPAYNRKRYEKYYPFFLSAGYFIDRELPPFSQLVRVVEEWNRDASHVPVSVKCVYEVARKLQQHGYSALFGRYGQSKGTHRAFSGLPSAVAKHLLKTFRKNFLSSSAPGLEVCYDLVMQEAAHKGVSVDLLPSPVTFYRATLTELEQEKGVSGAGAVYLARYGWEAFDRKYGNYADRDMSSVAAGSCWVFDHAQLDIMVKVPGADGFEVRRFWVTAIIDFKSWKLLYYSMNVKSPCTDDIKTAFLGAVVKYGVPETVYLDNGKDFRSRDFSGQSRKVRVQYSELFLGSILGQMGVKQIKFAIPYNAKVKIVERWFRKMHEMFERVISDGYTGSNPSARTKELAAKIKRQEVVDYEGFVMMFDAYVSWVNGRPMSHKDAARNGLSPDQVFERDGCVLPEADTDVVYRIAGRMSTARMVGRNGFEDAEVSKLIGYTAKYWGDWMLAWQGNGQRVYARREPASPEVAYFFDAADHRYLGAGYLDFFRTAALAETDEERARVAEVMEKTKQHEKRFRSAMKTDGGVSGREILERKARELRPALAEGTLRVTEERRLTGTDGGSMIESDKDELRRKLTRLSLENLGDDL